MIIQIIGLPGSGKTALATALKERILQIRVLLLSLLTLFALLKKLERPLAQQMLLFG